MTKQTFPEIPKLPHMSGKEMFEDKEKAKKWFEILHRRRAALAELINATSASMYSKSGKEEEEFIIVSPFTNGECRFQHILEKDSPASIGSERNSFVLL